jgi:hypothetical protein
MTPDEVLALLTAFARLQVTVMRLEQENAALRQALEQAQPPQPPAA